MTSLSPLGSQAPVSGQERLRLPFYIKEIIFIFRGHHAEMLKNSWISDLHIWHEIFLHSMKSFHTYPHTLHTQLHALEGRESGIFTFDPTHPCTWHSAWHPPCFVCNIYLQRRLERRWISRGLAFRETSPFSLLGISWSKNFAHVTGAWFLENPAWHRQLGITSSNISLSQHYENRREKGLPGVIKNRCFLLGFEAW